jgi:hypothetical protein
MEVSLENLSNKDLIVGESLAGVKARFYLAASACWTDGVALLRDRMLKVSVCTGERPRRRTADREVRWTRSS